MTDEPRKLGELATVKATIKWPGMDTPVTHIEKVPRAQAEAFLKAAKKAGMLVEGRIID